MKTARSLNVEEVMRYLQAYDGRPLRIMEVCGTHTASIFRNGIRDLISDRIRLISGPGCPVCVTPAGFIDRLVEYTHEPACAVLSFGDMMKVPGLTGSLADAKTAGGRVEWIYTPLRAVELAREQPKILFVVAGVGFETTAPAFGLMLRQARAAGVTNLKLLTALKQVVPALHWLCRTAAPDVDGFICPGHTSVVTGAHVFAELAERYQKPFVVSGFEAEHILAALYDIVRQVEDKRAHEHNLYRNVVRDEGNPQARALIAEIFRSGDALWRGLGQIPQSGLYLRPEWAEYDAGSTDLGSDKEISVACRCGEVVVGRIQPDECPLFGKTCTPTRAMGPCMVSAEGSCGVWYRYGRQGS